MAVKVYDRDEWLRTRRPQLINERTATPGPKPEFNFLRACYRGRLVLLLGGIGLVVYALLLHTNSCGSDGYHCSYQVKVPSLLLGIGLLILYIASFARERPSEKVIRKDKWAGRIEAANETTEIVTQLAMYSNNPTLARQAMVYNAQKEIGRQREIQAQRAGTEQALEEQRRAQDRADRQDDMRILAREMVQEMRAEVERERNR